MDIVLSKKELRKEAKAYRNNLSADDRLDKSTQITNNLKGLKEFQKADAILMYASLQGEVETLRLIRELLDEGKKEVYCPVTSGNEMEFYRIKALEDLKEGNFHVLEPMVTEENLFIPEKSVNYCVIMPGLMFDKSGNRLGYGKGYYDKFLAGMPEGYFIVKVGLSFEDMVREQIPGENTDIKADYIVTENVVYSL